MSSLLKGDTGSLPPWHDKPFRLTRFEMDNPGKVVNHYHETYSLAEIRELFRELLRDVYCSDANIEYDYLGFQDNTEKVLEALFVLNENGHFKYKSLKAFEHDVPDGSKQHWEIMAYFCQEQQLRQINSIITLINTLQGAKQTKKKYEKTLSSSLNRIRLYTLELQNAVTNLEILLRQFYGQPHLSVVPAAVELSGFLNSFIEAFDIYKKVARKQVEVTIAPDIGTLTTDQNRLRKIVRNLLHVALNYAPPGNSVTIDCKSEQNIVIITVSLPEGSVSIGKNYSDFQSYEIQPFQFFSGSATAGINLHACKLLIEPLGDLLLERDRGNMVFTLTLKREPAPDPS